MRGEEEYRLLKWEKQLTSLLLMISSAEENIAKRVIIYLCSNYYFFYFMGVFLYASRLRKQVKVAGTSK
jgi:hypothetical protein